MFAKKIFSQSLFLFIMLMIISTAFAQTTAFTYQGRLTSNSTAATGTYDFQFTLFDAASVGTQIATQTKTGVIVTGGLFTVTLDFGAAAFPGADRYLEIKAKKSTDSTFTLLTPRQQIRPNPYAIRSQSAINADTATTATQLGGIVASQYVLTGDSRLSDARAPVAGSSNYIQNRTSQQASSNFNISGTVGGAFLANTVTSNSTSNLILTGQSSSTIGSWLRLNNTSTGGHNWNIISSGSGNSEGAGKLLFNDQTSGGTLMQLSNTGLSVVDLSVLGSGTVSNNLTVNGTLNATVTTSNFATLPNCKARQTSAQTFSNNSIPNVRLDETQFCSGVTFDDVNDRLVIVTSGIYQVSAEILFANNSNGTRFLGINVNGGEVGSISMNAVSGIQTIPNVTTLVRLNAGDVVSIDAGQSSGGNLNTDPFGGRSASLSVNWVGP